MAQADQAALKIHAWERDRVDAELNYTARGFHDLNGSYPRELSVTLARPGRAPKIYFVLVHLPPGDPALGMLPGPAIAYQSWDRVYLPYCLEPEAWTVIVRELH